MDWPYLVVDLEATCDRSGFPRDEMEIIEIGAVLCDATTLAPLGEFQTFVRPQLHPELTAFCHWLTTITQAEVDGAPTFPEAIDALRSWLPGPVRFCSWGAYDRKQLAQDAALHGVELPLGDRHWNLKALFAEQAGSRPMGMGRALNRAGLSLEGTHHRGIDDARNIARLLPFCLGASRLR